MLSAETTETLLRLLEPMQTGVMETTNPLEALSAATTETLIKLLSQLQSQTSDASRLDDLRAYQREYQRQYRRKRMEEPEYRERVYTSRRKWQTRLLEDQPEEAEKLRQKNLEYCRNIRAAHQKVRIEKRVEELVSSILPKLPNQDKLGEPDAVKERVLTLLNTKVQSDNTETTVLSLLTTESATKRSSDTVIKAILYNDALTSLGNASMALSLPGLTKTIAVAITDLNCVLARIGESTTC